MRGDFFPGWGIGMGMAIGTMINCALGKSYIGNMIALCLAVLIFITTILIEDVLMEK